jgi:hypothetical protein
MCELHGSNLGHAFLHACLRTFKYDLATGEQCSYLAIDNALPVIMAYVTTVSDVGAYTRCKLRGLEIIGPEGPIVYEIPFRKLSFPGAYQFLGGHPDRDIYPKQIVHDVLERPHLWTSP